jgi:predicted DCC family thiol-disulfide oxidoreductase YuxK
VLYDADCGFCRWTVERIEAWDRSGRVIPVPIQSECGERLLASVPPARRLDSWHLVTGDGRLYSGGEAIAPLLSLLPGGRPLAALTSRFPRASDRLYRAVANRRAGFGRAVRAVSRLRAGR